MPSNPYEKTKEMFEKLSEKEIMQAIDRLFLRQQQLLLDAAREPSTCRNRAMSLVHSQGTIHMLFDILIDRAKNGRTEE